MKKSKYYIVKENIDSFIKILEDTLIEIQREYDNDNSLWDKGLLEDFVKKEIMELLEHARLGVLKIGKVFLYKTRKGQRMLVSTRHILDTYGVDNLNRTVLGSKIFLVQDFLNNF